jgi:cupin superfamily acireductone dioxygenase involved in methionine salvage
LKSHEHGKMRFHYQPVEVWDDHKTWKNVKNSLLTLNKVCTKVNKLQRETNYHTLDKLSYNPKNLTIVETPARSTFMIKKHLHHRYEEGGYLVFLKKFVAS